MTYKIAKALIENGQTKYKNKKLPPGRIMAHIIYDELNQINQKKKAQEIVHLTAGIYKNIEPEVESCLLRENWERNVEG